MVKICARSKWVSAGAETGGVQGTGGGIGGEEDCEVFVQNGGIAGPLSLPARILRSGRPSRWEGERRAADSPPSILRPPSREDAERSDAGGWTPPLSEDRSPSPPESSDPGDPPAGRVKEAADSPPSILRPPSREDAERSDAGGWTPPSSENRSPSPPESCDPGDPPAGRVKEGPPTHHHPFFVLPRGRTRSEATQEGATPPLVRRPLPLPLEGT